MSIIGNSSSTALDTRDIQSAGRGITVTTTESGNITAGTAKLIDSTANLHDAQLIVYDSLGNYLGASDVLQNGIAASLAYVSFTFTAAIAVTDATDYRVYVWGDSPGGTLGVAYDGGVGQYFGNIEIWPTIPDPDGRVADGRYYAVSLTVTPTGGSATIPLINNLRQQMGY